MCSGIHEENLLTKVSEDPDIPWTLLSTDVDEDDSQELLQVITELWLTVRTHSVTRVWMENYTRKELEKKRD